MKSFYLLIILLTLSIQISAQSRAFHLGVKLEFYTYTLQKGYSPEIYAAYLPSFHVIASIDLSDSISIIIKPGLMYDPFINYQLGFALHYKFPKPGIFLIGGLNMIYFTGEASNSRIADAKIICFLVFGAGYRLTDRLSLDICFHQALNGELGRYQSGPYRIFNMLKLGFAVGF